MSCRNCCTLDYWNFSHHSCRWEFVQDVFFFDNLEVLSLKGIFFHRQCMEIWCAWWYSDCCHFLFGFYFWSTFGLEFLHSLVENSSPHWLITRKCFQVGRFTIKFLEDSLELVRVSFPLITPPPSCPFFQFRRRAFLGEFFILDPKKHVLSIEIGNTDGSL